MHRPTLLLAGLVLVACANPGADETGRPDPAPRTASSGHPGPTFANAALQWRAERCRDERGDIPPGSWQRALQQRAALVDASSALDDGGIAPTGWTERGPFNVSGRTRTIVIDPRDTRVLWSGGVSGGLWKSTDRGATWSIVDDWWTTLSIASLCLDPSDPDVMYAGTGEGFFNDNVARGVNRSAIRGAGVLRSLDGGATWTQLPATANWEYVQRVAVSPADPNVLLAAVRPGGVYRSTDRGASWTQVHAAFASDQVLFDPADGQRALAHVVDASLAVHGVVWSSDAGATWSPALSGLVAVNGYDARIELCHARSAPGVVYASVGNDGGKVWRSADGGRNWVQRTAASQTGVNWYFNGFWVDPTNENVMVAAGLHVFRSTDGGVSFTRITNGYILTVDPHLDVHHVESDPDYDGSSNRRVYVATDGGLHVADDILAAAQGSGWRDLDNGLRSTQYYGAAGTTSGTLIGGTQDNGTLRLLAGATSATMPFGGDGGQVQIDPTNTNYVYGEYVWAQVHRSSNGGGSSSYIYGNINERTAATANFIAPLVLDPNSATRLYVGASSLWRTTNARASSVSWTAVKPQVGSKISAIAVAAGNADVVWVGHNDGRVYRTTNGTATSPTWITVDDNAGIDPLPDRYVTRIAIDPTDHRIVWLTLGGFASGNVRRTSDAGVTWSDRSGLQPRRLPDAPVNCVVLHPSAPDVVYVATEVGIFASDDGGAHWSASNDGPANVATEEVVFLPGTQTLLAATLGRGLWTCSVLRATAIAYGSACTGHPSPPRLGVDPAELPRIGQGFGLIGDNLQPQAAAFLVLGLSDQQFAGGTLPLDLGPFGLPGCFLLASPDSTSFGTADAAGELRFWLGLPAQTALIGMTVFAQVLAQDPVASPLGFTATAGVRAVVGR